MENNECNHDFVGYAQCCYCGAFKNARKEIIDSRNHSGIEGLRQEFIKWHSGVKETNGGYPPLAIQIFYWFEKNAKLTP